MEKRLKRVKDVCDQCEHNHNTSVNSELGECHRYGYFYTVPPTARALYDKKSKEFLDYQKREKEIAEEKKYVSFSCPYKLEHVVIGDDDGKET